MAVLTAIPDCSDGDAVLKDGGGGAYIGHFRKFFLAV